MHTSWGSNPICFLNISWLHLIFDPDDVSPWKTNIFRLGIMCHHEKCRGFGLFLDDIFINWYLDFISVFSKWYLQSCVDLGIWYNLDKFFSCHTNVCSLVWCFIQIVSLLVLESLVHAYLLYVYLMVCLLLLTQYIW